MVRVICVVIGYLFGIFQTAFFYGKAHGIDIREHGSGNSGTTNALRVLGKKAGLIVFVGDCMKCILAITLVRILFGAEHEQIRYLLCLYTAAGCVLGHNFPFYMGFKGGKGIAVTAGFVMAFHPAFLIVGAIAFFSVFLTTHYVSLGSLVTYAVILIQVFVCAHLGTFGDMTRGQYLEMYLVTFFMTAMAFWKHKKNIERLRRGEESKTYIFKKK